MHDQMWLLINFGLQGEECRSPFVINSNDDSCSSLSVDDVQSSVCVDETPLAEDVNKKV